MHIDAYTFGMMKINGTEYKNDLLVFPEKILPDWWRKQGHTLAPEDLDQVLTYHPTTLIVGRGASSMMTIPDQTKQTLAKQNIELIAQPTTQAWHTLNEHLEKNQKTVGAFHLTC